MSQISFNNPFNSTVYYSKNSWLKKLITGFLVVSLLGIAVWLIFPISASSKIEKEIHQFDINYSFQDFSSIQKVNEKIISEINTINSENFQQIKILNDKLNTVTSKKMFNLMQGKFDLLKKESNNLKDCMDLLNNFKNYKGCIKQEQYLLAYDGLLKELNVKITNEKFYIAWIDKKKEFPRQVKEQVELKWRECKYVGGCDSDHYVITSGYNKQEDFYPTYEIDREDHKKVVMKFTYFFHSKIKHRWLNLTSFFSCGKGDWDGNYSVEAKGAISLEGDANISTPTFQPEGTISFKVKKI